MREETAAHFFAKLLDNPASELRAQLDTWRAVDPRNAVAYAQIEYVWAQSAGLKSVAPTPDRDERPLGQPAGRGHGGDQ
jgi:ferric-dicitrate binding protein FerR (iron transport regulator)